MITKVIIAAAITLFFTPASLLFSQEHPEHPKAGGTKKQVSTADISTGIKKHITTETSKSGGKFHVKYEGQDLALDLIKVHDDRLQDLGDGKYFACVDMKGTDGKTYDIDFFRSSGVRLIRAVAGTGLVLVRFELHGSGTRKTRHPYAE